MAEQRKSNLSWIAPLILGLAIGAAYGFYRAKVKNPLDTEKIKLLADISQSSNVQVINVYGKNGRSTSYDVSPANFRDVLRTLAPVEKCYRVGVMRFPEYEFLFQTRMDPTVIYVREQTPTSLEFEIDGIIYTGGNIMEFNHRIEKIIDSSHVSPPVTTPEGPPESN